METDFALYAVLGFGVVYLLLSFCIFSFQPLPTAATDRPSYVTRSTRTPVAVLATTAHVHVEFGGAAVDVSQAPRNPFSLSRFHRLPARQDRRTAVQRFPARSLAPSTFSVRLGLPRHHPIPGIRYTRNITGRDNVSARSVGQNPHGYDTNRRMNSSR